MSERRTEPRIPIHESLEVEIDIHSVTNFYTGFVENISSGGLFIATYMPVELGTEIPLKFTLPNSPSNEIHAVGQVCWRREYSPAFPDTHPGMGLKFLYLAKQDERIINDYLTRIREPYFHPDEDDAEESIEIDTMDVKHPMENEHIDIDDI